MNHPWLGMHLYYLIMVIWGMVYSCFNHIKSNDLVIWVSNFDPYHDFSLHQPWRANLPSFVRVPEFWPPYRGALAMPGWITSKTNCLRPSKGLFRNLGDGPAGWSWRMYQAELIQDVIWYQYVYILKYILYIVIYHIYCNIIIYIYIYIYIL